MKKILSLTLILIMILSTNAIAASTSEKRYGDGETDYFSVKNVSDELTDDIVLYMVEAVKGVTPVVVTSKTELTGFGVSTMINTGSAYIEGLYLSPDGYDAPFDYDNKIKKGETFTLNDIGIYYVWATKEGNDRPVELTIEIDKIKASYTSSKVLVNGKEVKFEAYNINGNNYFKLRDIAKAISGTEKQFEVKWNEESACIDLISGMPYTSVGGELKAGDGLEKYAYAGSGSIFKDGEYAPLKAYLINDNNYFKLRDLGEAFDFDVSWDGSKNCITIDTRKSYTND